MTTANSTLPGGQLFGQLALAQNLLTQTQLDTALSRQQRINSTGQQTLLGEILVSTGVITNEQVTQVITLQNKRILSCPECFALFNVVQYDPTRLYRCRRCREYLVQVKPSQPTAQSNQGQIEILAGENEESAQLRGRALLCIESGAQQGSIFRLAEGETIRVGRQADLELTLSDPGVAPVHAKFRSSGLDVLLFDYKEEGGTQVNGHPIDFITLFAGDTVQIGTVALRIKCWEEADDEPLSQDSITEVHSSSQLRKDSLFGRELIESGLATVEQINTVLFEQDRRRKAGRKVRMGELMVEMGFLSEGQVMWVLHKQDKHVLVCPECKTAYNITNRDLAKSFKCSDCGLKIEVPETEEELQAFHAVSKTRRKAAPDKALQGIEMQPPSEPDSKAASQGLRDEDPPSASQTAISATGNTTRIDIDKSSLQPTSPSAESGQLLDVDPGNLSPQDSVPSDSVAAMLPTNVLPPPYLEQFGELALQLRYVTRGQLHRTLKMQAELREAGKYAPPVGELLVENRYITPAQQQEILKRQGKRTFPIDIPGYHLLKQLGMGSTGVVFRAVKLKGRRPVALKIIRPELCEDERFIRRFYREAETAMRLSHPNVVSGVDAGKHGRHLYMAMEFVEGETVLAYLDREGRMSERYSTEIGYQISLALEYAGAHNLIHRDVKPDNILLARDGTAKLIDLGLAKKINEPEQSDSQIVGTPCYISPEQAQGEAVVDIRSDIYSLGTSLYHMVTGELPFYHKSPIETLRMQVKNTAIPPHERTDEISLDYSHLIMRMMEKDPARRHQTWAEVTHELERLLAA